MKRLLIYIAALFMAVSCVLNDSDVNLIDAYDLQVYSESKMYDLVTAPVEAVEFALAFDSYLKLSDLEKEADKVFFGNITKNSENVYKMYVTLSPGINIECTIDTKGCSILEEGSAWTLESFTVRGTSYTLGGSYCETSLPARARIVMFSKSENRWLLDFNDDNVSSMTMLPMRDGGLYEWTVEAQGSETSKIGMYSEYSTQGALTVRERFLDDDGRKENVYSGQFNVNIFKDNEPHDYCYMAFTPGMAADVRTSR